MIGNKQIQVNFSLYEYLMGTALPSQAIAMNCKFLQQNEVEAKQIVNKIKEVSKEHQKLRNLINEHFWNENDVQDIGIEITSGFRCLEWEKHQGRSGLSQHTTGNAIDFTLTKVKDDELYNKIMQWIMDLYIDFEGGLASKVVNGHFVFIHIDFRGNKARWSY
jgi:hypothetical protein